MTVALMKYRKYNEGHLPKRIVVFRSGVSHGQYDMVRRAEIQPLEECLKVGFFVASGAYSGAGFSFLLDFHRTIWITFSHILAILFYRNSSFISLLAVCELRPDHPLCLHRGPQESEEFFLQARPRGFHQPRRWHRD